MQSFVVQAEQHGGGLVPLVMHHVSSSCTDDYCVSPTTLDQFLTWLQPRSSTGTAVTKIGDVVDGASGPASPPAAAAGLERPEPDSEPLARDRHEPRSGPGLLAARRLWHNTFAWTRTADAHRGSFG